MWVNPQKSVIKTRFVDIDIFATAVVDSYPAESRNNVYMDLSHRFCRME